MKKTYNERWVENLVIQEKGKSWLNTNLLSTAQFEQLLAAFPASFYRPGTFVKIGLFLFTLLGGSFFAGFLSLFFIENAQQKTFAVLGIMCAIFYYAALEYFIRRRHLFHSGIDNALLYLANGSAIASLYILFDGLEIWQYCIIAFLMNTLTALRYADLFTVFLALVSLFVCFTSIVFKFPAGKLLMPFALMLFSVAIFLLNKNKLRSYYSGCQRLVKIFTVFVFYLAGNYYVVREGNALLAGFSIDNAPQIPFAVLFYVLTALIPILYGIIGLKYKDRIFLIAGLISAGISCFTYRYYFDVIPVAIFLILTGTVLVAISAFAIHYLKIPRYGVSDESVVDRNTTGIESIVIAHEFGQSPEATGIKFDGGSFGGGGAGNQY